MKLREVVDCERGGEVIQGQGSTRARGAQQGQVPRGQDGGVLTSQGGTGRREPAQQNAHTRVGTPARMWRCSPFCLKRIHTVL